MILILKRVKQVIEYQRRTEIEKCKYNERKKIYIFFFWDFESFKSKVGSVGL